MIQMKALANAVSSVLMAEAAALTFAGTVISALQIQDIFFLSDSQQMVNFFNGHHHSSPPQWEIKPLTQKFLNTKAATNFRVAKIDRNLNITAHCLATQALRLAPSDGNHVNMLCSNCSHVHSCPTREALLSVNWEPFTPLAAVCC